MADEPKRPSAKDILFGTPKPDVPSPDREGRIKSNTAPELKRDEVRREIEPRGVVARVPAPGGAVTPRPSAAQLQPGQKPAAELPGKNRPFRRFDKDELSQEFNQAAKRKPKHKM